MRFWNATWCENVFIIIAALDSHFLGERVRTYRFETIKSDFEPPKFNFADQNPILEANATP